MKNKREISRLLLVAYIIFAMCFSFMPFVFDQEPVRGATFGNADMIGDGSETTDGNVWGTLFTMGAIGGIGDSITARVYCDVTAMSFKCAIYDNTTGNATNKSLVTNGITEEVTLTANSTWWNVTLDFNASAKPTLVANREYYLMGHSGGGGNVYLRMTKDVGTMEWRDTVAFGSGNYTGFPDPTDAEATWPKADDKFCLYCTYTESGWSNTAPTNTDFRVNGSVNGSTGISLYPQLNISTVDADGNNSKIYWETNASGSWGFIHQTNTSCLNSTYYDLNFTNASAYSTKYWVRISINDTHDNTTRVYHFTTESAPSSDTDYYVSTTDGSDAYNGLYPTFQGGSDGPWLTKSKVTTELNYGVISDGDDIYFNRGNSFTANTVIMLRSTDGTASDPMIIGAYGTGAEPILSRGASASYAQIQVASSNIGYWIFEHLNFSTNGNKRAIQFDSYSNIHHFIIRNCTFYNTPGILLYNSHYYTIEYCDFYSSSMGFYGSGSNGNSNSIVRHCTVDAQNSYQDCYQLHFEGGESNSCGPNHYIYNVTAYNATENGFDIVGGFDCDNVYLKNCSSYDASPGIIPGHGVENVTLDGCYVEDGSIYLTKAKNTIIRNSIVKRGNGDCLGQDDPQWYSGDATDYVTFYNNDLIQTGSNNMIQFNWGNDYFNTFIAKNNIFYSTSASSPTRFMNYIASPGDATLSNTESNYTYNMWWRGDGASGSHWYDGVNGALNWAQWLTQSEVDNDLRDDPEMADASGNDFTLSSTSPCIDAGDWLTATNGGGTGITITVHNANYFFPGLQDVGEGEEDISGDNIFVGDDTNLEIVAVDYTAETITVNRSITWTDGENVSLSSYLGTSPDIGAYEFNDVLSPILTNEQPTDTSTGISKSPTCNITVNDPNGDTMNITFASDYSSSWVNYQTNSSQPNGTYRWDFTNANSWGVEYNWRVYCYDDTVNVTETYSFTVIVNNSPVIANEFPANMSIDISLQPTCNATVTDVEDTIDVCFYNSSDGIVFTFQQKNSSVVSGTNVTWAYTQANTNGILYYWKMTCNDSITNISRIFHFTAEGVPPNSNATISGINPSNQSTGIEQLPTVNVTVSDPDGDNLSVYWYENLTGSYVLRQSNLTVTANTSVSWLNNYVNGGNQRCYWRVCVNDGTNWTNATYWLESTPRIFGILYVDNFMKYANNPIMDGSSYSWCDFGIRDPFLLVNDTGYASRVDGKLVIYFNGRTVTPSTITRIGRATSTDGIDWTFDPNPVFNDTEAHNYTSLGSATECGINDYIMYYTNQTSPGINAFNYATSNDSKNWTANRGGVLMDETNFTDCSGIYLPYVKYIDGQWRMVLEGVDISESEFHIYYANSTDRYNWTPKLDPIYTGGILGTWDDDGQANPQLEELSDGEYIILYNGRPDITPWNIGILLSRNLTSGWTNWESNPILSVGTGGSWDDTRVEGARIIKDDISSHVLRMWYFGLPTSNSYRDGCIGYATSADPYYPNPWQSNPSPANESTGQLRNSELSITVTDYQGDNFDVDCYSNASGAWGKIGSTNSSVTNGTYSRDTINMSGWNTTYYYSWNITDGAGFWENKTYHYATSPKGIPILVNPNPSNGSSITNTGVSWNIGIYDTDPFNWTMECNNTQNSSGNLDTNGTFYLNLTGLSFTTYTVYVNATNGNSSISRWYTFTVQLSTASTGLQWDDSIMCYQRIWTKDDKGQIVIVYSGGRIKRITGYDSIVVTGIDDIKKFEGLLFL